LQLTRLVILQSSSRSALHHLQAPAPPPSSSPLSLFRKRRSTTVAMKLNMGVLASAAMAFQAATVLAADEFYVTNIKQADNSWVATATWNRGPGDIRPIKGDGCTEDNENPFSDVTEVCFDWYNNRGHIRASGLTIGFTKRSESDIVAGRSTLSRWSTDDF
ncbi:hypothetical protein B0T22DRAFT_524290, partial [Podospora appendiculata]